MYNVRGGLNANDAVARSLCIDGKVITLRDETALKVNRISRVMMTSAVGSCQRNVIGYRLDETNFGGNGLLIRIEC